MKADQCGSVVYNWKLIHNGQIILKNKFAKCGYYLHFEKWVQFKVSYYLSWVCQQRCCLRPHQHHCWHALHHHHGCLLPHQHHCWHALQHHHGCLLPHQHHCWHSPHQLERCFWMPLLQSQPHSHSKWRFSPAVSHGPWDLDILKQFWFNSKLLRTCWWSMVLTLFERALSLYYQIQF